MELTQAFQQCVREAVRAAFIELQQEDGEAQVQDHQPKLLSVREVADFLRCSQCTVRRLLDRGDVPAVRVLGAVRVKESDLIAYLDRARRS